MGNRNRRLHGGGDLKKKTMMKKTSKMNCDHGYDGVCGGYDDDDDHLHRQR